MSDDLARDGHGEQCYECEKLCSSLAGNPGLWPVALCDDTDPGKIAWYHTHCAMELIRAARRLSHPPLPNDVAELVKRLRAPAVWPAFEDEEKREAADTIERLSRALAEVELKWEIKHTDFLEQCEIAERLEEALAVPEVWSDAERDGMDRAFTEASQRHGRYESLFAAGAWLLRYRAARTKEDK